MALDIVLLIILVILWTLSACIPFWLECWIDRKMR